VLTSGERDGAYGICSDGNVGDLEHVGAIGARQRFDVVGRVEEIGQPAEQGLLLVEHARILDFVAGIGQRAVKPVDGVEKAHGIAAVAARNIARQICRRVALQERRVGWCGVVFQAGGRRERADAHAERLQAVILNINGLNMPRRLRAVRAAEIIVEIVRPVAEQNTLQAQIDAPKVAAARKIRPV
jgi:hypothetical protein